MNINQKSTKDEIITSAIELVEYHETNHLELLRQRNALLVVVAVLATMVFW